MQKDHGYQNTCRSCTNKKYHKHVYCSYGYKLVYFDDKFSKFPKFYLSEDTVSNFINNMMEERKFCTDIMKKHFSKNLNE